MSRLQWVGLTQYVMDDVAVHVRQTKIAAAVTVRQTGVIEPHQVQNRGMKVVYVHRIVGDANAVFVGLAVHHPATHASASQPRAERPIVMLAAFGVGLVVERGAAKLGRPDDERFIEQAVLLEVLEDAAMG